ncbi:MAG TPA: hypothetical protein VKV35_13320 [Streptosporangiaceae bacterium]|jgi:hypothetical protein|nr:hypothetical protein [Streptosporangiaceae bacterium]
MSEFERDPSASTGRFRAFVERGEEDTRADRRLPAGGAALVAVGVVIAAIIVVVVALH